MRGKKETERLQEKHYRDMVTEWCLKLATHFNQEINADRIAIFIDRLPALSDYQINTAFEGCLRELMFFPKIKEFFNRVPDEREPHKPIATTYRVPTLDLVRPIAEEISKELCGEEYQTLCDAWDHKGFNADRAIKRIAYVFFCANIVRYFRMGRNPYQWLGKVTIEPQSLREVHLDQLKTIADRWQGDPQTIAGYDLSAGIERTTTVKK